MHSNVTYLKLSNVWRNSMKNQKLDTRNYNKLVSFIWSVADDCLRDVYVRGKYRDIILPMTVIRRFDAILEPKKNEILELRDKFSKVENIDLDNALSMAIDYPFYNISEFTLKDLKHETNKQNLKKNFEDYLSGFSPNVREILQKFKFFNQIDTMTDAGILGSVIEKFVSPEINLSPYPILNSNDVVIHPGLDNHTMGVIFEELIRRFNEENNEEAGEHFTPRDVIELMADLAIIPVEDKIKDAPYTIYDGAAGTLGMATVAAERFEDFANKHNKEVTTHLYGQEINPETYAIAKADMLIKGQGQDAENIQYGSTLSNDKFYDMKFDFMLSNPPYGKNWKTDLDKLGVGSSRDKKENIIDKRFVVEHKGESNFQMIPDVSDGQLLFLLNNISKMKNDTELGSRIIEVHNGSALFTGDANNGANNARQYMIENDLIEAIIQLPSNIFYNTPLTTYIWILSNRKEGKRKGKIQLIDASEIKTRLRKNMGDKNCELSKENRKEIFNIYQDFIDTDKSKIIKNEEFGYYQVTVERPLRLSVLINEDKINELKEIYEGIGVFEDNIDKKKVVQFEDYGLKSTKGSMSELKKNENMLGYLHVLSEMSSEKEILNYNEFEEEFKERLKQYGDKHALKAFTINKFKGTGILDSFVQVNQEAKAVLDNKNQPQPDSDLRDTELIPLTFEGGIDGFMEKEVIPYHKDAWVDKDKTAIGYEINFTQYFYQAKELDSVEDLIAEIQILDKKSGGLLDSIMEGLR